ncbi:neuroligin-4, X-linked-like [Actinia tenebrosa]|uniref:Carboxylic ester hydrolase n=1 Tax=Actinia tenebrosa TaxID=6105 RepID=A0A6P8H098_ACTTE|nr:neuroligin-4, X-linked-like [Actinia tenebrosa]
MPLKRSITTGIWLFLVSLSLDLVKALNESPTHPLIIDLHSGRIFGRREAVPHGRNVEMFLGIPYAEPPIDQLRFAAPRPVKPWNGTRDATDYGHQCMRGDVVGLNVQPGIRSEDCLYLNVYTPADMDKPLQQLPVMVWIHGGGLYHGAGSRYDGSVLASFNDVIVVTFNYRLGLLGFLNIPGTDLTGNYGMLDQVMALKWVQENIGRFGGDSDRVIIFGQSAGGVSTDLLILSPLTKGLFSSAIIQSGFATSVFAYSSSSDPNKHAHFVKKLQCDITKDLLPCLRSKTRKEIVKAQGTVDYHLLGSYFPVPVVDGHFLPDKPNVLLSEGRFNHLKGSVVLGVTRDEGDAMLYGTQPNTDVPPTRESFQCMFDKVYFVADGGNELVKQAILYEYTNHSDPDSPENLLKSWKDLISDSWQFSRAVYSANAYAQAGINTYVYQFSHKSYYSIHPKNTGVHHFDDVQYVFGVPWKENSYVSQAFSYTDVERGLSTMMMRLWSNVAIYGSPNGYDRDLFRWPEYNIISQEYLDIKLEPSVGRKLHADRMVFWNHLIPKLANIDACKEKDKKEEKIEERKEEL